MTPTIVAIIAAGALVIALSIISTRRREKARVEAMRSSASALGFAYGEGGALPSS